MHLEKKYFGGYKSLGTHTASAVSEQVWVWNWTWKIMSNSFTNKEFYIEYDCLVFLKYISNEKPSALENLDYDQKTRYFKTKILKY